MREIRLVDEKNNGPHGWHGESSAKGYERILSGGDDGIHVTCLTVDHVLGFSIAMPWRIPQRTWSHVP
ncbi:hypothetical protein HPP92_019482 [Vanilla planifolia]|uniref:Uncharacterized protein n=1 Tax=Vanilla planifolia TaxID=51239 RepID=A0A835QAD9_VANPL|nr:hypothetical protein HPP92_019482 [Vanilla planifolia]